MALKIEGFERVNQELKRISSLQRPALERALQSTATLGRDKAVDAVFKKYGFKERDYVDQHLSIRVNSGKLEARIIGRYRPSSIARFMQMELTKPGKKSQPVRAGLRVSVLRQQSKNWRSAFLFNGRNGNQLVAVRMKGEKWRKIPKSYYGPSVAGGFGVIRAELEPELIKHLEQTYRRLSL